jgi:hypothetical protein
MIRSERVFSLHLSVACLTLRRNANALLEELGVTVDQHVVLTALAYGDGITQEELVRRCYSDPNTVRAILVRLERDGQSVILEKALQQLVDTVIRGRPSPPSIPAPSQASPIRHHLRRGRNYTRCHVRLSRLRVPPGWV